MNVGCNLFPVDIQDDNLAMISLFFQIVYHPDHFSKVRWFCCISKSNCWLQSLYQVFVLSSITYTSV